MKITQSKINKFKKLKNLLKENIPEELSPRQQNSYEQNRLIIISKLDKLLLFLSPPLQIGKYLCCFWSKYKKMNMFYKLGKERVEKELNISKLVKNLRNLKILIKNSFLNDNIGFMIYHSRKNTLDIDIENDEIKN